MTSNLKVKYRRYCVEFKGESLEGRTDTFKYLDVLSETFLTEVIRAESRVPFASNQYVFCLWSSARF